MSPTVHRIVLADDHAVLRAGLRMLISAEPDLEVIGEAKDGLQAIERVTTLQPDVVLLDVSMPGIDGLEALPRLRESAPRARFLVLTMHKDEAYLRRALKAGAAGYLLKQAADTELLAAIRAVANGELYVHPSMTRFLLEDLLPDGPAQPGDDHVLWATLSEREQQVIRGIVRGYSGDEIAERHALSVKTVYTYRSRAMTKLGIEHRAELVRMALRLGLLDPDAPD